MTTPDNPSRRDVNAAAPARAGVDAGLEAEIARALGDMSVEDLLHTPQVDRRTGKERRRGLIVSVHGGEALVEFGPKMQGICPLDQFDAPPEPGTEAEFIIERFNRAESLYMLRREGAVSRAEWESLEPGQIVEAQCTGMNKGGLELEVAGHRAFMPAGQVDLHHVGELDGFVGQKLTCEVMEVDRARARIVLSRKAHLQIERARQREGTMGTLEVGQTLDAVITTVQEYGAFANIGGVDGLIHVSDLAWERVRHPSQVVSPGDRVRVKVLKVDADQNPPRISLGLKQTLEDPFSRQTGTLEPGSAVTGRVTRITSFGAFVEIEPGVEGLIHISELSRDRVHHVSSVVKPDQIVTAEVVSVDPDRRRIALSLKALASRQEEEAPVRAADPSMVRMLAKLNSRFGSDLRGGLG